MSYLADEIDTAQTPQSEALPGQVPNSAGGYSFPIGIWSRLNRFLILGTEGGSYYATQKDLTKANLEALDACLKEDPQTVLALVKDISMSGRALRNDEAILCLAKACAHSDVSVRQEARDLIPDVCRTGTHLFMFVDFVLKFRDWGRALRTGVSKWYTDKEVKDLAYQAIKYRQRAGWTHADVLNQAHTQTDNEAMMTLFRWIQDPAQTDVSGYEELEQVAAFQKVQTSEVDEAIEIVKSNRMTHEMVRPDHLADAKMWAALLDVGMPMTAMVRNLGNLTKNGVLTSTSDGTKRVIERLMDANQIEKSRIHPFQILIALKTYAGGRSILGKGEWTTVDSIVKALDGAFYTAFKNVEPTGQRIMLATDVSSSMTGWNAGRTNLTAAEAAAAMLCVTGNVEESVESWAFSTTFKQLPIAGRRMDDILKQTRSMNFGGTDCSLPMVHALKNGLEIDAFVVYTDTETWAGRIHPSEAVKQYRKASGIDAKMIVCGMVGNEFSIADPNDLGMLDVVGCDSATPQVIAEFIKGV